MDYIRVNATADGDNTVIAAPGAGKRLVIVSFQLQITAVAVTLTLRSGAAGTIHATFSGVAAGVQTFTFRGDRDSPAFICDANTAFNINNGVALDTLGFVVYMIEGA